MADPGHRAAPAHDAQGAALHRRPAARLLREGRAVPEAADASRSRGRHGHAREHGEPRDERQVRADAPRRPPAEVLLLVRPLHRGRRRRLGARHQGHDLEARQRRGSQEPPDGPGHRGHAPAGRRADRAAHGREVPRAAGRAVGADAETRMSANPAVSVLVPAKDGAENLPVFLQLWDETFRTRTEQYEVIVIDDGSTDDTARVLESLTAQYPFLRVVRHRSQRGIADALRSGFLAARSDILVFFPADLQFKPEDIPRLVAPIPAGESDMVNGFQQGTDEKAVVSRLYNRLSRSLFHVPVRDLNNVKAYRREIMEEQPARPDWHRYMIVLAAAKGYTVTEIPVPLYPRHAGKSKFGISRIPIGVLDMLAVWFELRFGQKPLLAFGMLGAALFAIGLLSGIVALVLLFAMNVGVRAVWTVIQTCLILGSVFFATGLLGDQIAVLRADQRELRRLLDEQRAPRGR